EFDDMGRFGRDARVNRLPGRRANRDAMLSIPGGVLPDDHPPANEIGLSRFQAEFPASRDEGGGEVLVPEQIVHRGAVTDILESLNHPGVFPVGERRWRHASATLAQGFLDLLRGGHRSEMAEAHSLDRLDPAAKDPADRELIEDFHLRDFSANTTG